MNDAIHCPSTVTPTAYSQPCHNHALDKRTSCPASVHGPLHPLRNTVTRGRSYTHMYFKHVRNKKATIWYRWRSRPPYLHHKFWRHHAGWHHDIIPGCSHHNMIHSYLAWQPDRRSGIYWYWQWYGTFIWICLSFVLSFKNHEPTSIEPARHRPTSIEPACIRLSALRLTLPQSVIAIDHSSIDFK